MTTPSQTKVSRRSFLARSAAGASLFCLPGVLFSQYESENDCSNPVILRFAALSDVHFKKDPNCVEAARLKNALEFMYDYSSRQAYKNFDAVLVAGDMTDHGWDEELLLFKKVLEEGLKGETQKVMCMGNHEFNSCTHEHWSEIFGVPFNHVYEVNGFQFIGLSPEKGAHQNGDYLYALDWFEKSVADACASDSNKPVFTFQHYHVTPTVYGSRGATENWGSRDLYETLQKYPRVINFSGHSHYPINDPRSAWQGRFTAFGTGTLSYFEMGSEEGRFNKFPAGYHLAAQMYVVEVHKDNSVILKPYDLISSSFFDVVYIVSQPGAVDKYVYTDERYKTSAKPTWQAGSIVLASQVESDYATLTFPQAQCADVVHSYRADVEKKVGDKWEAFKAQYYWSEYYFKNHPTEMNVNVEGLEELSEYRVTISALNPFFKESEEKLVVEFKTPKDLMETVDKNAPSPSANMLDVQFEDGKAVNKAVNGYPSQKEIKTVGSPKIASEPELNGIQVASFNGQNDRFEAQFTKRDYSRLGKGTLAAKFKYDSKSTGKIDVIANTEKNGISFEIDADKKKLEFWASVNGKYEILTAPIQPDEYTTAFGTYDGKTLVLYINGKEAARKESTGVLTHPTDERVMRFCIGSDVATGSGGGSNYFLGTIARAQIFTWGLTAEQVGNLSAEK